jgi:TolB protein
VLTPRFHPTRDVIAYMSYTNNRPRVYLFNLTSGRQTLLGDFAGMTFAPRFAPDGNAVIMAVSRDLGSEIVAVELGGRSVRRLTDASSINVSPCYSPDGSQVVFASDRDGDQQIYVMSADGSGARRISFGHARYGEPVWSPRGDLIAFTRYGGGQGNFAIGVMQPNGMGERILAQGWLVEGSTFCPNGRVIMYWEESPGGRGAVSSQLMSVDITGFNKRAVATPMAASDPAWSPLGG